MMLLSGILLFLSFLPFRHAQRDTFPGGDSFPHKAPLEELAPKATEG